jgi:hypothetical protein
MALQHLISHVPKYVATITGLFENPVGQRFAGNAFGRKVVILRVPWEQARDVFQQPFHPYLLVHYMVLILPLGQEAEP